MYFETLSLNYVSPCYPKQASLKDTAILFNGTHAKPHRTVFPGHTSNSFLSAPTNYPQNN